MSKHSAKFLMAMPITLTMATLAANTAFAGGDPLLNEAVGDALGLNDTVAGAGPTKPNCDNANGLPDAPQPQNVQATQNTPAATTASGHPTTLARVLSKVNFQTSGGFAEDPTSPGPISLKGGAFGVTYGDKQITQMLSKFGIENSPDTKVIFNVTVTSAPLTAAVATTAGNAAIKNIKENEAGMPWEQSDIDATTKRVKYLKTDAYTQKITVSMAVLTKEGKMYTCEVGKEPEVFLRPNDPNGSTNPIELATGGSSDALRVGSSYSTSVLSCTAGTAIGKDSKFQVGLVAYKDTLPYKNENVTFGNDIYANDKSFDAQKFGLPNSVRADFVYDQKVNNQVKLSVAGTGGVALGKPVYSLNTTVATGRNSFFADTSQGYYTGMNSSDPNDNTAEGKPQKQTGKLIADSYRVYRNYSLFCAKEWDKGVPDAAQASSQNGVVDFDVEKCGAQYERNMNWGSGRARLIVGGDVQKTWSPDNTWTPGTTTNAANPSSVNSSTSYNVYLKISASGKLIPTADKLGGSVGRLVHLKKRKNDNSDAATSDDTAAPAPASAQPAAAAPVADASVSSSVTPQ